MGLTLDESKDGDEAIDKEGISIVYDSQIQGMLKEHGGISIDFANKAWQRGFIVKLSGVKDCC